METVGQRFTQLIAHLGISKNAFASSLGKTATVIQHLVDERNKPGFDLLCSVFENYPNVSKDWLLQGIRPMLTDSSGPVASLRPEAEATKTQPLSSPAVREEAPAPETAPAGQPLAAPTEVSAAAPVATPKTAAPKTPAANAVSSTTEAASTAPPAPVSAATTPDASWQTALYTQQMSHQLALAELRNQHLQEQQRLMQQMLDLMQRQLPR